MRASDARTAYRFSLRANAFTQQAQEPVVRFRFLHARISPWLGAAVIVGLFGGVTCAVVVLAPRRVIPVARPPTSLPPGSYHDGPLPTGSVLPQLEVSGWVNGSPPARARLIVLDIWAHW